MAAITNIASLLEELKDGTSSVLKLSSNDFEHGRYDLAQVAQFEAAARENPHVTTVVLDCSKGEIDSVAFVPLVKALYANLPSATKLELLAQAEQLVTSLEGSEHFTSIHISLLVGSAAPVRLGVGLQHHTHLRTLSFTSPKWPVTSMHDLHMLPSSLVDINLDAQVMTRSFDFLRSHSALSSLAIYRLELVDEDFSLSLLQSKLQHLKISTVFFPYEIGTRAASLFDALENMTTLVSLDVHADTQARTHPPPVNLAKLLQSNSGLQELRVCTTRGFASAVTNEAIVAFVAAMADPACRLHRLQLTDMWDGISASLVHTLLTELKRVPPTSLRHLSLKGVGVADSDGCLERVACHMEDIFALPFISITLELGQSTISKNAVSCLQGQRLVKKLQQNYTLESLNTNLVESDCLSRLQSICRLNGAGRGYLKTGNAASRKFGVDVLIKVKDELDDLFTHLVEDPSLCNRAYVNPVDVAPIHASKKQRTE